MVTDGEPSVGPDGGDVGPDGGGVGHDGGSGDGSAGSGGSDPAARPPLLVSACLLGVRCNHRGEAGPVAAMASLASEYRLIPICPETAGGLPTPRPAAEIQPDGRVRTATGHDVTEAYERGARAAVAVAAAAGVRRAILKARSPSCGCHEIYDGTFGRALRAGDGVTTKALRAAGVEVISEDDLGPGFGGITPQGESERA